MRRDYKNRRTVFLPDRTLLLILQILRCNNRACSRFKRPHRPEIEWHYALPDTKFGLATCNFIYAAYIDGKSKLAIFRELTESGIECAPRSVANVIHRYEQLFKQATLPWSAQVVERLKADGKVFLDILVTCQHKSCTHVLVRDCFSSCLLAGASITTQRELLALFHSVIDRLPVPEIAVCYSSLGIVPETVARMWPRTPTAPVLHDGRLTDDAQGRR